MVLNSVSKGMAILHLHLSENGNFLASDILPRNIGVITWQKMRFLFQPRSMKGQCENIINTLDHPDISYDAHYLQQSESSLSRQKLTIKGVREMKGRGRAPSARERRKKKRSGSVTNGTQKVREQIEDDQKSNRTLALLDVGSSQRICL